MRIDGGYSIRRLIHWVGISASLLSVLVQCRRLYLIERNTYRAWQALGALIQLVNGLVAAIFELFPSLHAKRGADISSEVIMLRCRRRHLVQMIILNVMRAAMQSSYSYLPLVDLSNSHLCSSGSQIDASVVFELPLTSGNTCLDYQQVAPPRVSPLAQQVNAQVSGLELLKDRIKQSHSYDQFTNLLRLAIF